MGREVAVGGLSTAIRQLREAQVTRGEDGAEAVRGARRIS